MPVMGASVLPTMGQRANRRKELAKTIGLFCLMVVPLIVGGTYVVAREESRIYGQLCREGSEDDCLNSGVQTFITGLLIATGIGAVGLVILLIHRAPKPQYVACPYCAKRIYPSARRCRYCRRSFDAERVLRRVGPATRTTERAPGVRRLTRFSVQDQEAPPLGVHSHKAGREGTAVRARGLGDSRNGDRTRSIEPR